MKKLFIKIICLLAFLFFLSWSNDHRFISLEDAKLFFILLICTIALLVYEQGNTIDLHLMKRNLQWNTIVTGFIVTLFKQYGYFSSIASEANLLKGAVSNFKPIIFSILLYLIGGKLLGCILDKEALKPKAQVNIKHLLTRREKEIYDYMLTDLSNKEIACELYISESTVKKHIQNILKKIGFSNREELRYSLFQSNHLEEK